MKEALKRMLKDGEFEKLIKTIRGNEKSKIKEFYDAIKDFTDEDFDKIPEMMFIQACMSYILWQDIYCYMKLIK